MHKNSANKLLERLPEAAYIEEWTKLLSQEKKEEGPLKESSLVVFRLHREWLSLSTLFFSGIAEGKGIHSIPHRDSSTLLGVVNLRGQLKICVNLHSILQVDAARSEERRLRLRGHSRMLAIQKDGEEWVFPVDEIHGIHQLDLSLMQNVPVNVSKSTANFLKGVISWDHKKIGYLDEELLFASLANIGKM